MQNTAIFLLTALKCIWSRLQFCQSTPQSMGQRNLAHLLLTRNIVNQMFLFSVIKLKNWCYWKNHASLMMWECAGWLRVQEFHSWYFLTEVSWLMISLYNLLHYNKSKINFISFPLLFLVLFIYFGIRVFIYSVWETASIYLANASTCLLLCAFW